MTHPWPLAHPEPVLDEALDIALNVVEAAGNFPTPDSTQQVAADAILDEWKNGSREKGHLAETGIRATQGPGPVEADVISVLGTTDKI
jgi:hypothetical protein